MCDGRFAEARDLVAVCARLDKLSCLESRLGDADTVSDSARGVVVINLLFISLLERLWRAFTCSGRGSLSMIVVTFVYEC
jgi:hypothetical protein